MFLEREDSPHFSPDMAVARGMMSAQSRYIQAAKDRVDFSPANFERLLAEESLGKCEAASATTIHYLQERFPDKFDFLFLMVGSGPFSYNSNHIWHAYFVAKSEDVWYSGSPANHNPDYKKSHLTHLIASPTLGGLLKSVKEKDGGMWHNPHSMLTNLDKHYSPPVIHEKTGNLTPINIFTFDKVYRRNVRDHKTGKTTFQPNTFRMERYNI